MVVDGDGEGSLRSLLAHHVLVQDVVDLLRLGQVLELEAGGGGQLLVDDLVAEIDALVADVDAGTGDQLLDLTLRFPAERAEELLVGIGWACQRILPSTALRSPSPIRLRHARPRLSDPCSLLDERVRPFKRSAAFIAVRRYSLARNHRPGRTTK